MLNSAMPKMPGMGSMTETFEFVKNLWGGAGKQAMGIPGMVMPTLSIEEVDKQIKDLKAVESWLTINMNMLRGTIQALEVQSATITALQTMGQNFSAAVSPAGADNAAPNFTFAQQAGAAAAAAAAAAADEAEKTEQRRKSREALKEEFKGSEAAEKPAEPAAAEAASTPAGNPAHWWNMLQDQFKQAVNSAMTPEAISSMSTMSNAAKSAMENVAKSMVHPAVKTAAKSPAKPAPAESAAKTAKKTAAKPATKAAAKPAAKPAAKKAARKPAAKG
jgi:hypothetical protein